MTTLVNSAPATGSGTVTIAAPVTNSTQTLTLPDETGTFLSSASALNPANLTGGAIVTNPANAVGYGAGSGGTVTQATSKSTAVTLNKPTGQITMSNAALAAGALVDFIFNNSLLTTSDLLVVNIAGGIASGSNYRCWSHVTGGARYIAIENRSVGSLSEAVVINFAIIKGATA